MSTKKIFRFWWEPALKGAFANCAKSLRTDASTLARRIIEEWMACQLDPKTRKSLGLGEFNASYPHLLSDALGRFQRTPKG